MAESYHIRLFNERVRTMNQTRGKNLTLTAQEAQTLHSDIYELMTQIAELTRIAESANDVINVNMDGGGF